MIVFPMAGRSSRFSSEGYAKPKYMLELSGRPTFDFAIAGFLEAFRDETFVFVVRGDGAAAFVEQRVQALGVIRPAIVHLGAETRGQAETVELGLAGAYLDADAPLTIFNIDTFRPRFRQPAFHAAADGWLEVFQGTGANWSFVRADGAERVAATAEKDPISDLCCTGLYHFRRQDDFASALARERRRVADSGAELYVAPLYNHLIADGRDIRYRLISREDVLFCGVPAEYRELLQAPSALGPLLDDLSTGSPLDAAT